MTRRQKAIGDAGQTQAAALRYSFTVDGNPIPKARARVANGHAFTPARTAAWEQLVSLCYMGPKFEGELAITMRFYRDSHRVCDWDNLAKAVQDALNGKAWGDDSQIVEAEVSKGFDKARPRVEVTIERLEIPF